MANEFRGTLDTFEATPSLDKQSYICACGLCIGIGVDKLDPSVSILRRPALLRAAHQFHHDNHFGTPATLYMIGGKTPTGIETLIQVQCSCEYDKEHPDAS